MLLKIGSKGEDVKKLQSKLGLNDDGDFGPATESAVIKFQKQKGLNPDGLVGDGTWSKLFEVSNTIQSVHSDNIPVLDLNKLKGHLPEKVFEELPSTCAAFNIVTSLRLAHFLSQCAHESGHFKAVSENLNYSESGLKKIFGRYFPGELASEYARKPEKIASRVYGGRMGNGDEPTGEGYKFRGRGYIQLTGKSNYTKFGNFIGEDLVSNPDLVATKYALASAAFFFNKNNLWSICDKGSNESIVKEVTKRVNGGYNGLDDRLKNFNVYWNLLK
jgi:putative chitinase